MCCSSSGMPLPGLLEVDAVVVAVEVDVDVAADRAVERAGGRWPRRPSAATGGRMSSTARMTAG